MLFPDRLVLLRGGGDLATGAAWRLSRAGLPVIVSELPEPLTIRRTVAVSSAVALGEVEVEGMRAVRCGDAAEAVDVARRGDIAVVVEAGLPPIEVTAVVDARMAKRNLGTTSADARLVVGLGPGFSAGEDCHAVVETMRGPHLGRVIWSGPAADNTGTPGVLGGRSADRVICASRTGTVRWRRSIGDRVVSGETLGSVEGIEITAPFDGVVRGLLADGQQVEAGVKIADIDPRGDPAAATEISDKALAVGGGVLEAVLTWLNR
jgi:xanthine dehydrogenase accessory factor